MKKVFLVLVIVALCFLTIGALTVAGAVLATGGDFGDFSVFATDEEITEEFPVSSDFSKISVSTVHDVVFKPSADGSCKVTYVGADRGTRSVSVDGDTLLVTETLPKPSLFSFYFKNSVFTVFLPKTAYDKLAVKTATGDVTVPAEFTFTAAQISVSTGDVAFRASADDLSVTSSTGDIFISSAVQKLFVKATTGKVRVEGTRVSGPAEIETSTGDIQLNRLTCDTLKASCTTGKIKMTDTVATEKMTLSTSTGDIRFTSCDSAVIEIKASTGDVSGSLRTGKMFSAHSSTGSVRVPDSDPNGGKCTVNTSTGDIRITVENSD